MMTVRDDSQPASPSPKQGSCLLQSPPSISIFSFTRKKKKFLIVYILLFIFRFRGITMELIICEGKTKLSASLCLRQPNPQDGLIAGYNLYRCTAIDLVSSTKLVLSYTCSKKLNSQISHPIRLVRATKFEKTD